MSDNWLDPFSTSRFRYGTQSGHWSDAAPALTFLMLVILVMDTNSALSYACIVRSQNARKFPGGRVFRAVIVLIAFIWIFSVSTGPVASAEGKCTSIQAQCAIEIGGRCDPKTGRWQYGGGYLGRVGGGTSSSGGTNRFGAFDACVSRKQGQGK